MKRDLWQNLFGPTPDSFADAMTSALEKIRLQEDEKVMKRFRFSAALVAAVLLVVLGTGAAFAFVHFGALNFFTQSQGRLTPLPEAEKLVVSAPPQQVQPIPAVSDDGQESAQEDRIRVSLEELLCDGQSVTAVLRLTPQHPETEAIFCEELEDSLSEEVYDYQPKYDEAGVLVGDKLMGRKDGKSMLYCALRIETSDPQAPASQQDDMPLFFNSFNAVSQSDGSVLYYAMGVSQQTLPETLDLRAECRYTEYDSDKQYLSFSDFENETVLTTSLTPRNDDTQTVALVPVAGAAERFSIVSGSLSLTPVAGYYSIDYTYEPTAEEEMGITFRLYTPDGTRLPTGSGVIETLPQSDGTVLYRQSGTCQTLETLPDTLIIEAKVIGEDKTLGRVTVTTAQN